MAQSSMQDMYSLPDVLASYNFDLLIPNPPGGGDGKALAIKIQTTEIPGYTIEPIVVALHGFEINKGGRGLYSKTLAFTAVETIDLSTRDTLINWMKLGRDARNNRGALHMDFATTADLILYDDTRENEVRRIRLYMVWPSDVQASSLDGASSTAVTISGTLTFDSFEDL